MALTDCGCVKKSMPSSDVGSTGAVLHMLGRDHNVRTGHMHELGEAGITVTLPTISVCIRYPCLCFLQYPIPNVNTADSGGT